MDELDHFGVCEVVSEKEALRLVFGSQASSAVYPLGGTEPLIRRGDVPCGP